MISNINFEPLSKKTGHFELETFLENYLTSTLSGFEILNHEALIIQNWIVSRNETISASDQNSHMPFLRNEFTKIFKDLSYDEVIYIGYKAKD